MLITIPETASEKWIMMAADWAGYQQVLAELDAQGRRYRSTYADGVLEVLVPGDTHEAIKDAITRLLYTYAEERDINVSGLGSTTFTSVMHQKGLEVDQWFYVGRAPEPSQDIRDGVSPVPDLAIEVDVSRSSVPREPVYAALGVGELWRVRDTVNTVRRLAGESYETSARSRLLPSLELETFMRFVGDATKRYNQQAANRAWANWLRESR